MQAEARMPPLCPSCASALFCRDYSIACIHITNFAPLLPCGDSTIKIIMDMVFHCIYFATACLPPPAIFWYIIFLLAAFINFYKFQSFFYLFTRCDVVGTWSNEEMFSFGPIHTRFNPTSHLATLTRDNHVLCQPCLRAR
jgi:hypothetical protein